MPSFRPEAPWYANYPEGRDPVLAQLLFYEAMGLGGVVLATSTLPAILQPINTPFHRERMAQLGRSRSEPGAIKVVTSQTLLEKQSPDSLFHIGSVFPPGNSSWIHIIREGREPNQPSSVEIQDFVLFAKPPEGKFDPAMFYRIGRDLHSESDEQKLKPYQALADLALASALGYGESLELLDKMIHDKVLALRQK